MESTDLKVTFSSKTCPKCKYVMRKCRCTMCKNCGFPFPEMCECGAGVIPAWQRDMCVKCGRGEKFCKCEKFIKYKDDSKPSEGE